MISVEKLIPGSVETRGIAIEVDYEPSANTRKLDRIGWRGLSGRVNADLLLHKFLPHPDQLKRAIDDSESELFSDAHSQLRKSAPDQLKRLRLEAWCARANETIGGMRTLRERLHAGARDTFTLRTAARLLVGVGGASTFEIGLTIHPMYGFPIIPGSSLKGLAQAAVRPFIERDDTVSDLWAWLHSDSATPPPAPDGIGPSASQALQQIFGSPHDADEHTAGAVTFDDSWPETERNWYEVDVLTPHFGEYYRSEGKTAPSDHGVSGNEPKPVHFPVVRSGIRFHFTLRLTAAGRRASDARQQAWLAYARALLLSALTHHGAGAKTRAGYGYFAA